MKGREIFVFLGIIVIILIASVLAISVFLPSVATFSGGKTIALLTVNGEIADNSSSGTADSSELVDSLEKAASDPAISAILIEIDSPGGYPVATKRVVRKIEGIRAEYKKPVVAYIGEMGASGGYYIASACDHIMADEDSITGSIGVISMVPDVNGLLSKLGISIVTITGGNLKAMGDPFHEMTDEERAVFEEMIQSVYKRFKADVLRLRAGKVKEDMFDSIADGRVLTGAKALEYGLIDSTGTYDDAITKTAELAKIEGKPEIKLYSRKRISLVDFFGEMGSSFASGFRQELSSKTSVYYK